MYATVREKIYIWNPSAAMLEWCRIALIMDNPDYIKKKNMGLWTGNMPRQLHLFEKTDKYVAIPFGCLRNVHEAFPDMPMYSSIRPAERVSYDSRINLYPYQENAVQAITEARNGILVMPCGAGKTQTALEAIARVGMKALWLTHTQDLLNQSYSRAKSVLGIDSSSYGTITAGKVNIGRGITFATVQTMSKIDLAPYRKEWGVIVVDECHKAVGSPTKAMQFYKVLSQLSCRYKIGVTATPRRADGLHKSMFALLGDIIYEVGGEEIKDTVCEVVVQKVETGYMPDIDIALAGDGTINYAGLVDDMTHNENRFEVVMDFLASIQIGQPVLVLANRVEYLRRLCTAYKERKIGEAICLSAMGNSKSAKAIRKEAMRKLNEGKLDCIFATYALAREGLDVPNLRYVVFSTPEKDPTTIEQSTGRVRRKADGKSHGTVIDFVDDFGMYKGWWKKRLSVYKKIGCDIIE